MAPADPRLADRAAAFDAGWLASQRWFRSKARRLESVAVVESVALSGDAQLVILAARHADGGEDRYLVPAVAEPDGTLREPRDGEGAWRGMAAAMADGTALGAGSGRFAFHADAALGELLPGGASEALELEERRLSVEQSNTSVQLGDCLMLKVYRLLEPGITPEVEIGVFLTEVGFRWTPPLAGQATWQPADGEASAAAMLQGLVPAQGDGWGWILAALANPPDGPRETLAAAAQIGGITAELHEALASRPDAPGFGVGSAGDDELAAWRQAAERSLDQALEAVTDAELRRLEAVADRVRERFAGIHAAPGALTSRIHGDYHLGQLLRTESGFMVIDFEGEPARPLAERRRPASPLRDVAGMLRSFDYAARSTERAGGQGMDVDAWLDDARSAFLTAYGELTPAEEQLLAAFEAEKACYEVRYEANNRPDWTWLPIDGLERLAA
jgi:maltose alpha-D-glucosyltransferase/alpha-amylase